MDGLPKILLYLGLFIILIGGVVWALSKVGISIGKMPGDLHWGSGNFGVYFPIVSMIVISVILTVIINLIFWLLNK